MILMLVKFLMFPDCIRGLQAKSEACLLTHLFLTGGAEVSVGDRLRCVADKSESRRWSCEATRVLLTRVELIMELRLGLLEPDIGLRC